MMGADVANAGFRKTESRFAETGNSKFQIPNFKQILNSKVELTRFRGHLILREKGAHDAKKLSKVPT